MQGFWKREFKILWREAGQTNHLDGKVDSDQKVVNKKLSLARQVAHLYGHSFTPVLNFALSLAEASKDIGLARPLALIAWNSVRFVFRVSGFGFWVSGSIRWLQSRLRPLD